MISKFYKKGQIATALTWIVAFGIIFFIMVIFLGITFTVSAGKGLKIVDVLSSYGKNEISITGDSVRSSDYNADRELYSLLNELAAYKGSDVRIIDLLRYYSKSGDEESFNALSSKLENELDVLYDECYSFCFSYGATNKKISGAKCTDLSFSCSQNENLPIGANYRLGKYLEKENLSYEIKLYSKNKNGK